MLALVVLPRLVSAEPGIQYVGRAEGLPSTQVHAVVEAGDGFVWFAGPSGLARYDGWRVVTFGRADGLTSQGLRALALDPERRLWIGTDAGVDVRETDGRIHPLVAPETWRFGIVDAIAAGPEDTMWIATTRGLLVWAAAEGLRLVADPRLVDRQVSAVVADVAGRVWAAVPSVGLLRRDGETWTRVEPPGLARVGAVRAVAASPRGVLLVGGDQGLAEIDAGGRAVLIGATSAPGTVGAVVETGDELWLGRGAELRLLRRRDGRWQPTGVVFDTGLVNDFAVDRLGNVWAATDRVGVAKISALRHGVLRAQRPCPAQVFAIARDADAGYLIGGDQCSWAITEDGRIRRRLGGLDRIKVWDLLRARDGTVWAATENGLYHGAGERPLAPAELVSETLEAPGRVVLERDGTVWVGTVTGLVEIRGSDVRDRFSAGGSPLGYVYTLERGEEDRIWVGTIGNGLWRETRAGGFERVFHPEITDTGNVYSLAFGPRSRVVVAQDDRLILLEADGSARRLATGGAAVAAWSLLFDRDGRLWAGGATGLIRYDLETGAPELRLTSTMGLAGEEFTTSRSLVLARDGRLLCGLDGGLTIVVPAVLTSPREPPRVRLVDVEWSNARFEATSPLTVVHEGPWTLEAAVAAPWFVDERSLTYRHRLRGFDPDWRPAAAGGGHQIRYTGLPAGTYTLEAQARSPLVGWGPAETLMRFRVIPPWWRGPWALAAFLILLSAGGVALWRWRTRRLLARGRELEAEVAERTDELRLALLEQSRIASRDELTGLANQRAFWEQAKRHAALAKRHRADLSLVVLDLDRFKRVNDTHGHRAGDRLLADVARRLVEVGRESDLLARYGGEEFVVLMPGTSEPEAAHAAERLRRAFADTPFVLSDGDELTVTASLGVSSLQGPDDDVEALFRRADAAVYLAKRTRDAVAVWAPETTP